jgi:non-ribosomal peptide synthetase component F
VHSRVPNPPSRRSREAWTRALVATSGIAANPTRLLPDIIVEWAGKQPDAPALVSRARSLTYSQLAEAIEVSGRWALAYTAPGETVGLLMPNRPEYVAIWAGSHPRWQNRRSGQHQPARSWARPCDHGRRAEARDRGTRTRAGIA